MKSLLLAMAIGATATASAQVFQRAEGNYQGLHRGAPAIADINNDGLMDIYYGGEYYGDATEWVDDEWNPMGIVLLNNGDGTFKQYISKTTEAKSEGKFGALGLPPTIWGMIRFFDFNNDGNIDFLATGKTGDGWVPGKWTDDGWKAGDAALLYSGKYTLLYQNGGKDADYNFSLIENHGIYSGMANEFGDTWMGGMNKSSISFGDYDRDGYVDVLMQGMRNWRESSDEDYAQARVVALFHNNGDGTFTATNTDVFKPMTHGGVMFGDLNNDGWLDIVSTGWTDSNPGGQTITLYVNNGDGTFSEVTDDLGLVGVQESDIAMADFDSDGRLDLLVYGSPANEDDFGGKVGSIYYNRGGVGEFKFEVSSAQAGNGLDGASETQLAVIDLNQDGRPDVIVGGGWTPETAWKQRVYLQNADGTFTKSDIGMDPDDQDNQGGWTIGHLFSERGVDFAGEQERDGVRIDLYANATVTTEELYAVPEPQDVKATIADNKVVVTWTGDEEQPGLAYNVYIKNTKTGEIASILPADTETGKLRALQDLQTLVRSAEVDKKYEVSLPEAEYEIGVAAVDAAGVSSKFVKFEITTGIRNIENAAATQADNTVYSLSGQRLSQPQKGINIINGKKIIK